MRETNEGGAGGGGPVGGRNTSMLSSFAALEAVEEFSLVKLSLAIE